MLSRRLKQIRLARGLSLEDLATRLGGLVTKQALSKYELAKAKPSPVVLTRIASALDVKAAFLLSEPAVDIQFLAYRKHSALGKHEQEQIQSFVAHHLEERIRLQELIGETNRADLPAVEVHSLDETEEAAVALRGWWNLGLDPIANVTHVLEQRHVHVIPIRAPDHFDGLSAVALEQGQVKGAAIASRSDIPGERQRLNMTHELGHLIMRPSDDVADEEKAAFRFGAAFLAPREVVFREVGARRSTIQLDELLLLKRQFGLSIQALLYRLHTLEIISPAHYERWCRDINYLGWRKHEPEELPSERPSWLMLTTLRALDMGLLTTDQAERLLGDKLQRDEPPSLMRKTTLMRLSVAERRQLLAEQATRLEDYYTGDHEWKDFQEDDIVEDSTE